MTLMLFIVLLNAVTTFAYFATFACNFSTVIIVTLVIVQFLSGNSGKWFSEGTPPPPPPPRHLSF